MTLSLTCTCGARLEIDEKFAGQTITCPDCQKPLRAPGRDQNQPVSGLALASLVLALAGAFTIVGSFIAVVLGFIGLREINSNPESVGGRSLAKAGIGLGIGLGFISLLGLLTPGFFGLAGLLREVEWAGKVDYAGALKVAGKGFTLTRPSGTWGLLRKNPAAGSTAQEDLVLVSVREDAYALASAIDLPRPEDMAKCQEDAVARLRSILTAVLGPEGSAAKVTASKVLPAPEGKEKSEAIVEGMFAGRPRTFLVHVFKVQPDKIFVIAAGARSNRFERLQPLLEKIVESFTLN